MCDIADTSCVRPHVDRVVHRPARSFPLTSDHFKKPLIAGAFFCGAPSLTGQRRAAKKRARRANRTSRVYQA